MVTVEDLKNFNLFTGLDSAEMAKIANLCTRRTYEKDAVIFDPNSSPEDIYLVEGGNDAIQIEIPISEHGTKIVIHTLSKGETFGWASIVPVHSRTAIARCLDKVDIIRINGRNLVELLDQNNHMGYLVMKNLSGIISSRLAYTTVVLRRELQRLRPKVTSKP